MTQVDKFHVHKGAVRTYHMPARQRPADSDHALHSVLPALVLLLL